MPIPLGLGQELWLSLRAASDGYSESFPLVVDNGVTQNGLGNMVNGLTGVDEFVSLSDVFGVEGNIMIRGFISWPITNVKSRVG
jgi:hypothetical protein